MNDLIQIKCAILLISLLAVASCSNNDNKSIDTNQFSNQTTQSAPQLSADLLGIYHGIQPSYFMKNQYGDDMIINGNKVRVPSIDFKFVLKESGIVRLHLRNLEDNSKVYYHGTITVLNNASDIIKLECSLGDGHSSNLTYTLVINKLAKSATCIGNNEPEVKLQKNNHGTAINSSEQSSLNPAERGDSKKGTSEFSMQNYQQDIDKQKEIIQNQNNIISTFDKGMFIGMYDSTQNGMEQIAYFNFISGTNPKKTNVIDLKIWDESIGGLASLKAGKKFKISWVIAIDDGATMEYPKGYKHVVLQEITHE